MKVEEHLKLDQNLVLVPQQGKTGTRAVWITNELATDLRRWLRKRSTFAKCDYVFVTDSGEQCSEHVLPQTFRAARLKTGVKGITPHALRHYMCTTWLRKGGDIAKLREMTGHKRLESLEHYLHLVRDRSVGEELNKVNPAKGIRPDYRKGRSRTKI